MPRSLLVRIEVDDKGNARIRQLADNAKKVKTATEPIGDIMKKAFAATIVVRGLMLLNQGLREAVRNAADFELQMKKVSAIGQVFGSELNILEKSARDFAMATEHSAVDVSKAMLELSKTGEKAVGIINIMPTALNLATVAGTELGQSTQDLVSILRQFNLETTEVDRVANVMAKTVNSTLLDFEDFMEAMKFVGPIANSVGMSLEETSALMGSIGDMGMRGSLGGTALKNMFLNILKPSDDVAKTLADLDMTGMSFADMLKALADSGADVKDFLETFNKRAVTPALGLSKVSEKVNELTGTLLEQGVTIGDMSDVIRDATANVWKQMINMLNEIGLSIADAFGDRPKSLLQAFISKLKEVNTWINEHHVEIRAFAMDIQSVIMSIVNVVGPAFKLLADNLILVKGRNLQRGVRVDH